MAFGAAAPSPPLPIGRVTAYLVGVAGLAFCIALLWFGMRAVMDIGGACASGGPYVPRVTCPDAVVATTPLSILGGFLFGGLMLWAGAGLGGGWAGLVFLAWPALFLSLGWNFLEYGFVPPEGGWVWSWIFCGVLFIVMGAAPLVVVVGALRAADGDGRSYAGGRIHVRPAGSTVSGSSSPGSVGAATEAASPPSSPVVDRLERLAALHERGDLTDTEYDAAKSATLGAEAGA